MGSLSHVVDAAQLYFPPTLRSIIAHSRRLCAKRLNFQALFDLSH